MAAGRRYRRLEGLYAAAEGEPLGWMDRGRHWCGSGSGRCAGRRGLAPVDAAFVMHGVLIGVLGILLFGIIWLATTGSLAQPPLYVVAHVLKVLGGITGGLVAEKRKRHVLPVKPVEVREQNGMLR
jgi:hypothetical protein